MGGDFLTPKAIANRIKAKGLQKLRWYCQMCNKQCRDANGFKCHCDSESHQRMMQLFADESGRYLNAFSKQFHDGFMTLLRRRFHTKRIYANRVYQEYIQDRHHIHMNSTQWTTLTQFIKWLGREGMCKVDETPKGWYIAYIDQEELERKKAEEERERAEATEEERQMRILRNQQKLAESQDAGRQEVAPTELKRADPSEKVQFTLGGAKSKTEAGQPTEIKRASASVKRKREELPPTAAPALPGREREDGGVSFDDLVGGGFTKSEEAVEPRLKRKLTAPLMPMSGKRIDWLSGHKRIIVKVNTRSQLVGGKFDGKKGVVSETPAPFTAMVRILNTKTMLRLDQDFLSTVIPNVGGAVMIVVGELRGKTGTLERFDTNLRRGRISIAGQRDVPDVDYRDFCKLSAARAGSSAPV